MIIFKAKRQVEKLEADLSDKDRELYEIRHELVSAQVKLEENQKLITSLREEADDYLSGLLSSKQESAIRTIRTRTLRRRQLAGRKNDERAASRKGWNCLLLAAAWKESGRQ